MNALKWNVVPCLALELERASLREQPSKGKSKRVEIFDICFETLRIVELCGQEHRSHKKRMAPMAKPAKSARLI